MVAVRFKQQVLHLRSIPLNLLLALTGHVARNDCGTNLMCLSSLSLRISLALGSRTGGVSLPLLVILRLILSCSLSISRDSLVIFFCRLGGYETRTAWISSSVEPTGL